ncbi:hypothetical protein [Streptococcus acidominimus]|uniref:Uncharacterized protein n=1 Tax=Streptococcus acidominimus TaxID=1326 RepID=A0A4Y9FRS1_STRAI|nr:hypothetical protein [Streptococcus acidominimus]MBF0818447.1 hypothetical protein [Streptococcus acidominimus]MBF0838025.1 hypothetical protein [Streptococcus acidominimus]MBF0848501.1 hypothetical protein [Streptococcus danieliae]TFU31230.1 hypothetical protein E4U01_03115 [Streptococcus acidominimus]
MYTVMLELILDHQLIVSLQNKKNNLRVYVLVEDVFRKADLHKDFSHLYPEIYKTDEDFQQDNCGYNLIRLTLFPQFNLQKVSESKKGLEIIQEFNYMAENLVEHRYQTDHAVIWENELIGFNPSDFCNHETWLTSLYKHILSFSETEVSDFRYIPGHL